MALNLFILVNIIFVLLLINQQCSTILVGNPNGDQAATNKSSLGSSDSGDALSRSNRSEGQSEPNVTFHYEANEFLINKETATKSTEPKNSQDETKTKTQPIQADQSSTKTSSNALPPASVSSTSARNGRMLDLDAFMGDFAASQSNSRQRASQTGSRQSRFLSSGSTMELGGKKLQIQGFIPIISMKDDTNDDNTEIDQNRQSAEREHAMMKQIVSQSGHDLPYGQSSIGHASFGVQRYLQTDNTSPSVASSNTPNTLQQQQQQQHQLQQIQQKSGPSSLVDSLKKPLRRLAGQSVQYDHNSHSNQQKPQDCLCVPFYMCKNGFISESSVTKSQIQQLIAQQQQNPPRTGLEDIASQPSASSAQYADSFVPVDERSLDRDLISAFANEGLTSINVESPNLDLNTNATQTSGNFAAELNKQAPYIDEAANGNSTSLASQVGDYSQEILGRMLGIKSGSSSKLSSLQQSSSVGSCGLLRTCCSITAKILASFNQPDGNSVGDLTMSAQINNPQVQNQISYMHQQQHQQQQQQQQRYSPRPTFQYQVPQQQASSRFQTSTPLYGLPKLASHGSITQNPNTYPQSQAINSLSLGPNSQMDVAASLAHRSTQFQTFYPNQFTQLPATTSANQQTRMAPQILPIQQPVNQAYQQANQQQSKALIRSQSVSSPLSTASHRALGSRKILEGRCGLRQSSGINGRVQNLQYHESSADFGEYPAQAAILKRLTGSDSLFVCGGTLISQHWVATAAHCIKKHAQSELKVRLGEWDVHRDDEFYPFVEKEVRDIVMHPEFVAGNLVNDIALLRLDSAIDPTLPHINPACLPTLDESFSRQRCWVTGWGKDSFGQKGSFQSVLQEVELPVVGQGECESALRQTRLGQHYRLHSGFICAGGEGGRDACEGDGGSGLYCLHEGVIKVAGLVSWGIGCGQAGVPGVYVNMAFYRPWIENIISIDEDIYSPYLTNTIGGSLVIERSNTNKTEQDQTYPTSSTTTTSSSSTTTTVAPLESETTDKSAVENW